MGEGTPPDDNHMREEDLPPDLVEHLKADGPRFSTADLLLDKIARLPLADQLLVLEVVTRLVRENEEDED